MSSSGTIMVPEKLGDPATFINAHHSLEEVLRIAGKHEMEPFCSSFGPMSGPGNKPAFAALIVAYNASGSLEAVWISDPMFGTPEAAQEHAEDCVGPEIWPWICGFMDD